MIAVSNWIIIRITVYSAVYGVMYTDKTRGTVTLPDIFAIHKYSLRLPLISEPWIWKEIKNTPLQEICWHYTVSTSTRNIEIVNVDNLTAYTESTEYLGHIEP